MFTMCHTPNGRQDGSDIVPSLILFGENDFTYKPIDIMITVSYITELIKFKMMRKVEKLWFSNF
jgi:hypothetical protein